MLATLVVCGLLGRPGAAADGAAPATSGPAASGSIKRQVLQSFLVGPYTYELSLENCSESARPSSRDDSECVFAVRLFGGGKELDRLALVQPSCGPATPTSATWKIGADRSAKAWETGDEHCDTEIAARTLDLAPNLKALLVTELAGFEYPHRTHSLFFPKAGHLETAWTFSEDMEGTHRTSTTVIPGGAGSQDLALIEVVRKFTGETASVEAERIHFDPAKGEVVATPLPDGSAPLFVLEAGRFKSIGEGLKAWRDCLRILDVFRSKSFAGLHLPAVFHGAAFARRADAEAAKADLATCPGATDASIVEFPALRGRSHASHH